MYIFVNNLTLAAKKSLPKMIFLVVHDGNDRATMKKNKRIVPQCGDNHGTMKRNPECEKHYK
jgi:hypothetical protein